MKKLIVLVTMLALMVMATAVLAGPPEQSPWEPTGENCPHPSDPENLESGELYENTITGMTLCFKAE